MSTSATGVLQILCEYFQPKSVLDVGCGRGAWLAACGAFGCNVLQGFDGPWVKPEDLIDPNISFRAIDLEQSLLPHLDRRYDLAISVEVAEHVSEAHADQFINGLCEASDVVLFSAAIKHQGGTYHVNEQWQSYWVKKFAKHGYDCYDVIRAPLWDSPAVEWWYKQNIFLYVLRGSNEIDEKKLRDSISPLIDVVQPELYVGLQQRVRVLTDPSFKDCFDLSRTYLRNRLRRLLPKKR
jgi:SAM-dependent methyltransferase